MKTILLIVFSMLFCLGYTLAKDSNTSGTWNTAANWTPSGVPAATEVVNVNHSMNINTDINITSGTYTFNQSTSASSGRLTMSGGTLEIKNNSTVSFTNTGTFGLSGGSIIVRAGSTLNLGSGTSSTINLSGVTILVEAGGTLNLNGTVNRSSTASIIVNGTLNTVKTFTSTAAGTITVNGTANINTSGASTDNGLVYNSLSSSATIDGTGSLSVTGKLLFDNNSNGTLNINVNSSFTGALRNNNSNSFTLNVFKNTSFGGFEVTNGGNINVKSGGSLTYNSSVTIGASGINQTIEEGATMTVNGNLTIQNSNTLKIDGLVQVNGNYDGGNATVTGDGNFYSTGSMTTNNSNTIFGTNASSQNGGSPCNTGPCDGRNLCGRRLTVTASFSAVCSGSRVTISSSYTPGGGSPTYIWESRTGSTYSVVSGQTATSYSPTVSADTYYRAKMVISGCTTTANGVKVTVDSPPAAPTGVTGTTSICSGSSTTITATGGGSSSYRWYNAASGGTLLSSSASYNTGTLTNTTTYYVATVSGGCESTSRYAVTVTVNPIPSAPTAGSNSPLCTSDASINLTASTVSGGTYAWTGPASFTSSLQNPSRSPVTVAKGGTYSVTVTVNGCTSSASTVTVTVNTTPSAPTAGSNSPVYEEGTINLTASNVSGATYSWTGPNSFISSAQNPSITNATIAMGGTYSVTATTNGCTSPAGTVTVVVNPLTFTWTGNSNSVWNNTGNWSSAMVPNSTRTVTIPSGRTNYPNLVGETADINNLTVQSGGSVTLGNNSSLTVRGDINNSGTLTGTTGSTVVFTGSSNGTVTGTTTFHNVTLNKTSGFSVTLSNSSTVHGAINLTSGELRSNGNLILNLDSGYINKGGLGSITGNMTVTRTVSSIRTHYFSVPLDGATVADLTDDIEVFNTVNGVSRLFQYSEPTNAWTRITSGTAPLIKGIGYSLYFTRTTVLDITGTYDHSYVHNVTFTNTANGWKFVGNPYPSTIDWDAVSGWTKTNLNNAVNYWEGSSGQYISYVSGVGTTAGGKTADQYIPAMNGFWVQTTGTGGATSILNMTSNVRSSVPMTLYRDVDMSNVYSLTISNGTVTDEAIIRFNDASDPSFESEVDANKLINTGSIPSVASTMVGSTMSINTMPVPTTVTEIPLYVKVASNGNYTLTWSSKNNPLYGVQLFLYDKKLGTSTAIVENVAYTITQSTTDSTNRYMLKLVPSTTSSQNLTTSTQSALESSVRVYARDGKVYVEGVGSVTREVEGDIITVGGTPLDHFTGEIGEGVVISRTLSQVSSGMYLVRISSNGQQATYRVVMY
jgi:hypothetical protein